MASLVTLEVAKQQLRVPSTQTDEDDLILRTVEDASGIVLDYLKDRANAPATILTSSVASPTVIETEEAHGFTSGDTAVIADHEDSTPDLDGSYVVTVLTTTTFSIPVAVTVAGTGGTATVAWTTETAPYPVKRAVLVMVTHLYANRGEDMAADEAVWSAIRRLLERSRDPAYA